MLRLLHDQGPRSRAAVATDTGLNKATVSRLVADLIDRGLVRELGLVSERRRGRPATLLEVDGRHVAALGLELNVDFITAVAIDLGGPRRLPAHPAHRRRRRAPRTRRCAALTAMVRQTVDAVAGDVRRDRRHHRGRPRPRRRGRPGHHLRAQPPLAATWRSAAGSAGALGRPVAVSVDNDANLGAFAEYRVGKHAGTPNLIYITGQTGVGGGIIVDGRLLRGASRVLRRGRPHAPHGGRPAVRVRALRLLGGARRAAPVAARRRTRRAGHARRRPPARRSRGEGGARRAAGPSEGDARVLAALERHGRWLGSAWPPS